MGSFSRNQGENRNNITSVVLIEQTQKYKNKTSWGLSFSNSAFGDPIAMSQTVPDGTELTFSGYGAKDFFLCTRPMKIQHWGTISILRMSVLHMNINIASAYIRNVQQAIC